MMIWHFDFTSFELQESNSLIALRIVMEFQIHIDLFINQLKLGNIYYWFCVLSIIDFQLVSMKSVCEGDETFKDFLPNVGACAEACKGSADMFIFGTEKDGGGSGTCKNNFFGRNKQCKCWCQHNTENSKCKKMVNNDGFNLFAFKGRYLFLTPLT